MPANIIAEREAFLAIVANDVVICGRRYIHECRFNLPQ